MKHIRRLRLFESTQELNQEQIDFLNRNTRGEWGFNPNTGLVDIDGYFDCELRGLDSFKGVKFGVVYGNFNCSHNSITSLEGAPQEVGENFYCSYNSLTSLEGAPQKVGRGFFCYNNSLTSLKGAPQEVGKGFYCSDNSLTSLEGAPKKVGGGFTCSNNSLTSLEGSPKEVVGSFDCSNNSLNSLEGAPEKVGGYFDCSYNSLTSLEGAPKGVGGGFYCQDSPLNSLKGSPKEVGSDFYCDEFELYRDEWNPSGWIKILEEGTEKAKKLILTLPYFEPENLQNEIKKNPGKWVMELKGVWNLEEFRSLRDQLKLSDQFLKDIGSQSGLSDLGF